MEIRRLGSGDGAKVRDAAALFDHPIDEETTRVFLADDRHHLLLAFDEGRPVVFATGVELLHPDACGPEMFLYEIAVAPEFRRRGVARELIRELIAIAERRGCYGMFVLTDEANEVTMALYASTGGRRDPDQAMFTWGSGSEA